jgi:hypothetical protein
MSDNGKVQVSNNGHKGAQAGKPIEWEGMGAILRPMEGGKGADVLLQTIKQHKDYPIITRTILQDNRQATLVYQTIEAFIEDDMWEELQGFLYFLELQLSIKGIGINSFLQAFTGIYSDKGAQNGLKRGKWFNGKKDKEEE